MSERDELAAACIFPSFPGDTPPDWVRRFLAAGGGGIVLFAYNVPSRDGLAALCAELRAERDDVLLAIDEEGGDVTRLEWDTGSSYPGGAALGAVDDPELTEGVAASIAGELASVGVNWNLAPVADVNVPANPVIGTRAFGSDAELVARHVGAWVRGLQSRRVAACAKHWPGHGSTTAGLASRAARSRRRRRGRPRAVPRRDRRRRAVDHDRAHPRARASRDDRPGTGAGAAARPARLRRRGDGGRARDEGGLRDLRRRAVRRAGAHRRGRRSVRRPRSRRGRGGGDSRERLSRASTKAGCARLQDGSPRSRSGPGRGRAEPTTPRRLPVRGARCSSRATLPLPRRR